MGPPGAVLGDLGRLQEGSWERLGGVLGVSWGVLGGSWGVLGVSWEGLGGSWECLGRLLGGLGRVLGGRESKVLKRNNGWDPPFVQSVHV